MIRYPIVLATANARYTHCSFGLRRLWSALGPLRDLAVLQESTIQASPQEIAGQVLSVNPQVTGFGVYLWNVDLITRTAQVLRMLRPDILLVAGGPELAAEDRDSALCRTMDYCVVGEGETVFARLAARLLRGDRPPGKIICAGPEAPEDLADPYDAYGAEDWEHRIVYVESSRGCPFRCSFCLSGNDHPVRYFPLPPFLDSLEKLIQRGARRIKFVDRTFNLREDRVLAILDRLRMAWQPGLQVHFELMPHLLSEPIFGGLCRFPANGLHLEMGLQTVTPEVLSAIGRSQNVAESLEWIRRLRAESGAFLHADLLAGLPGETLDSFGAAFDAAITANPQEIQVGILKRLKGTSIAREAGEGWAFAPFAPYEVLCTPHMSFEDIRRIKRFARYFDLYYNSGNLPKSVGLLWGNRASPFAAFLGFSDWLWEASRCTHHMALSRAAECLYQYLSRNSCHDHEQLKQVIEKEFRRFPGRRDKLRLEE